MVIGANGMLASASIKTSSGHQILDDQALDMLKKGKTTVPIPGQPARTRVQYRRPGNLQPGQSELLRSKSWREG